MIRVSLKFAAWCSATPNCDTASQPRDSSHIWRVTILPVPRDSRGRFDWLPISMMRRNGIPDVKLSVLVKPANEKPEGFCSCRQLPDGCGFPNDLRSSAA